jgi:hypothetical protein
MKKTKTVLSVLAVVLVFAALLGLLTQLVTPKYATDLVEGSMISQYYREAGDHDVIFIGDCEVYSNFSPMEMYRQQGITAYVRGTSQQLIWQSYYILKETLKYEIPKVVVYNVNAMRYAEPIKEEFNRLTIDNMRWSEEKVGIIRASMTEEETFASYVFPILRYHSRFQSLTGEDLAYLFEEKDNTFNGYLMKKEVRPVEKLPAKRPLASYQFSDTCYGYLEQMAALCKEHNVELVLIKAPSLYPYWYEEHDAQIQDFASRQGLAYYDLTKEIETIGLDFTQDTYDAGLHLNLSGATKLSGYFAQILVSEHGVQDRRSDPEIAKIYDEKLRLYDEAAQ